MLADPSRPIPPITPIPQPQKYDILKQGTPFYIYGRARDGSVVAYQLSGRICPRHLSTNGVKQVRCSCLCVCACIIAHASGMEAEGVGVGITHDG